MAFDCCQDEFEFCGRSSHNSLNEAKCSYKLLYMLQTYLLLKQPLDRLLVSVPCAIVLNALLCYGVSVTAPACPGPRYRYHHLI